MERLIGKATIHTYSLKKFQKLQQLQAHTVACPKSEKGRFGFLGPLGVKKGCYEAILSLK
jgi:hypothetical protein